MQKKENCDFNDQQKVSESKSASPNAEMDSVVQDIERGQRKQVEKGSFKSEDKYRTLFESIDEGFCIIEVIFDENDNPVNYRYEEVNPAFEEHTGNKNVEGELVLDVIPDLEDKWFETYGNVALTGEPTRFRRTAVDKYYDVYAFPFGREGSNKIAVLFNDITKRKENEYTNALLSAIVKGSDDAIVSKDLNSTITSWNIGAEEIFGYTAEEAIGQSVTMLMTPDRVEEEDHILHQIRQGQKVEHFETVRQRKDGSLVDVSLTISPIYNSEGKIIGASKIARDITKRKEAEEKLKALNDTLEERVEERTESLVSYQDQLRSLASQLSKAEEQERHRLAAELHDNLGQMLAVSKMKVDLLDKDTLPDETAAEIEELSDLIKDSLTYTRDLMSDLKPPPSLDKEDVTITIEWLANKMEKHDLEVILEDDGQPKQTTKEIRTTLLQCVREVLFNVVKHTEENKAQVSMSRLDNRVQIIVEDEGQGFDPENNTSSSVEEGGFGLFNIRERMDLLGGTMEISSEPGEGTRVKLIAPAKDVAAPELSTSTGKNKAQTSSGEITRKIKVLLADDHQMIREGLKKIVDAEDDLMVIAEASDGNEAIELARETSPDIIIMDVDMPRVNGIDATQEIIAAIPDMRVVGLSFHDHREVVESMRSAGASAFLSKEEAFETLCATIRSEAKLAKK